MRKIGLASKADQTGKRGEGEVDDREIVEVSESACQNAAWHIELAIKAN